MKPGIHIGTSGWSYRHWRGLFYPPKLPTKNWLAWYARHFDCTEINASFYRLPSIETVHDWMKHVPQDFLFCPKMSRFLTHMKKLLHPEEPLERFFEVFAPMNKCMGPVLVQLPPNFRFEYDRAEYFYKLISTSYRRYEFVIEVRHDSWLEEKSLTLMSKYNIGLVISQSGHGFPYAELITAGNIYIRFHGPKELYASLYTDEMLEDFARRFLDWEKEGHTVWAFFNNDIHGYAIDNAKRMRELLKR